MTMSRDANVAGVQAEPKEYTSGISLREVIHWREESCWIQQWLWFSGIARNGNKKYGASLQALPQGLSVKRADKGAELFQFDLQRRKDTTVRSPSLLKEQTVIWEQDAYGSVKRQPP